MNQVTVPQEPIIKQSALLTLVSRDVLMLAFKSPSADPRAFGWSYYRMDSGPFGTDTYKIGHEPMFTG